jgi:transposase-like protein
MARRTAEGGFSELQGSRPWSEDEARRVIDAWRESGETVAAFARREGLVAHRVYWWRGRLGGGSLPAASLLPVVVRATPGPRTPSAAGISVWTRQGHRIDVTELDDASARWVAMVMKSISEEAP